MDKEFVIGTVFEKIDTKKITGKANDFPTQPEGDYNVPLLTAGIENQGLARYAMRSQCPTILSNVISVSANGANSGVVFYHPEEFAVLQDAYAIQVRNYEIPNAEVGLYLTSALYKAVASTHDWNYKAGWNRIKEDKFALPIKVDGNGNPIIDDTHFYHEEGFVPDFEYMEKYIAELEQERIAELEQYLIASGLNDYELTDEDIETLSLSGFGHYEERDSEDVVKVCKEMREFRCGDLFDIHPTKAYKMSNDELYQTRGNSPVLSNSSVDNGIGGYCGLDTTENGKIITFSDTTTGTDTMFYQPNPFIGYAHVQGMYPFDENWGEFQQRYFICAMKQACGTGWDYSNKFNRKLVAEMTPLLPIQTDANNNPIIDTECKYHPDGYILDWDFMEKYIKAIEKIVIADVVKYKDSVIEATKK